jgi:hypothetical protein
MKRITKKLTGRPVDGSAIPSMSQNALPGTRSILNSAKAFFPGRFWNNGSKPQRHLRGTLILHYYVPEFGIYHVPSRIFKLGSPNLYTRRGSVTITHGSTSISGFKNKVSYDSNITDLDATHSGDTRPREAFE